MVVQLFEGPCPLVLSSPVRCAAMLKNGEGRNRAEDAPRDTHCCRLHDFSIMAAASRCHVRVALE